MSNERQQRAARAEQMRRDREKAAKRQRSLITTAIVVVVVALIAGAAWGISAAQKDKNQPYVAPQNTTSDFGIEYTTETATGKAATNPVSITMYEDFQCPACQAFEAADGQWLQQAVQKGEVTLDYRPVAFLDGASSTEYSTRGANAALCVLDEKGVKAFYDMHQLLYANQPPEGGDGLPDKTLVDLAGQAGAKGDAIKSCIDKRTFEPWVDKATKKWRDAGFGGTPTVVVAGKEVKGKKNASGQETIPTAEDLEKAVQAAKKG